MRRVGNTTKPERVAPERQSSATIIDEIALPQTRKSRAWHVIHACEYAREVENVVEAQLSVGMTPYVVTGRAQSGEVPSLMQAWQGIRTWRTQLDECASPFTSATLRNSTVLHAHSFTAGMAAVRGNVPAIYDLRNFIEEQAAESGQSWLSRSFRTAEQFVLTRAGAIVVHGSSPRNACLERGVDAEDIFIVPDPVPVLPAPGQYSATDTHWLHRAFGFSVDEAVAVVAKVADNSISDSASIPQDTKQLTAPVELVTLLRAFAQAHSEHERAKLFVVADSAGEYIRNVSRELDLDHAVFVISSVDSARALTSADIVLDATTNDGASNSVALAAMFHGRALLAPDLPANRDLTPEGRGCLWYKPSDKKDLANRLAFLARNRDFRKALGDSGRRHILDTRSPERIGRRYAEVYGHAQQRSKRSRDTKDLAPSLIPTNACL